MDLSFHYMLMTSHLALQKKLMTALRPDGLTVGQPKVLDYLIEHNGANQKEIAQACHIEPASLTSILNGMEEKNMIERKMLHGNRRSLHIFVTPKGRQLQKSISEAFHTLEDTAFDGLSEDDRMAFMRIFKHIYENLTEN